MQTLLEIYNHKEINLDVTHVDSMLRHYGDKRRLLVVTWSVSAVTAVEVETPFLGAGLLRWLFSCQLGVDCIIVSFWCWRTGRRHGH